MINVLLNSDLTAFKLETTSVVPMEAEIVGISFSVKENEGYYVPLRYPEKGKNNFGEDDEKIVLNKLTKFFEDKSKLKTGQNIKYDSLVLKNLE